MSAIEYSARKKKPKKTLAGGLSSQVNKTTLVVAAAGKRYGDIVVYAADISWMIRSFRLTG